MFGNPGKTLALVFETVHPNESSTLRECSCSYTTAQQAHIKESLSLLQFSRQITLTEVNLIDHSRAQPKAQNVHLEFNKSSQLSLRWW